MKRTILALSVLASTLTLAPAASAEFLIGPRVAFGVPVPNGLPELGVALDMRVSNPSRMIQFGFTLHAALDGESGVLSADMAHSTFLGSATEWVPYLGGGAQVRSMFFDRVRVTSFAAQAQLGIMSSRVGRRRLFVEVRAVQNLLAFGAEYLLTRQPAPMPDHAYRFEPSVNAGFLF